MNNQSLDLNSVKVEHTVYQRTNVKIDMYGTLVGRIKHGRTGPRIGPHMYDSCH